VKFSVRIVFSVVLLWLVGVAAVVSVQMLFPNMSAKLLRVPNTHFMEGRYIPSEGSIPVQHIKNRQSPHRAA